MGNVEVPPKDGDGDENDEDHDPSDHVVGALGTIVLRHEITTFLRVLSEGYHPVMLIHAMRTDVDCLEFGVLRELEGDVGSRWDARIDLLQVERIEAFLHERTHCIKIRLVEVAVRVFCLDAAFVDVERGRTLARARHFHDKERALELSHWSGNGSGLADVLNGAGERRAFTLLRFRLRFRFLVCGCDLRRLRLHRVTLRRRGAGRATRRLDLRGFRHLCHCRLRGEEEVIASKAERGRRACDEEEAFRQDVHLGSHFLRPRGRAAGKHRIANFFLIVKFLYCNI